MDGGRLRAIEGRTRNSTIFHKGDGYFYIVREIRGNRARLKCRHYRRCHGTGGINILTLELSHNRPHNHDPDVLLPMELQMRRAIVSDAARSIVGRTPRQILNSWKLRCPDPQLASRFTAARMRSTIKEIQWRNYPRIPRTLMALGLLLGLPDMRAITRTRDGQDLILRGIAGFQGNKTVSLIFASWRFIQFLASRQSIHLDGTFKRRPKKPNCSQIYNVTTRYGGTVICLVRVIMMRRTEAAYLDLFNYLMTLMPNFRPRTIHCDFERAQMNAVATVWPPPTRVVGCLWHYGVATSSKARSLGLKELASDNEIVFTYIRSLCAVPLLPSAMITEGVDELWQEVQLTRWHRDLEPLFCYFRREWQPRLEELSVHGCIERTNNCAESDNHSMSVVIPRCRPSIWQCIGAFVHLEYLAWQDKLAVDDSRVVNDRSKWSAVLNDKRVKTLTRQLEHAEITAAEFLQRSSWCIQAAAKYGLKLRQQLDESDSSTDSNSDANTGSETESSSDSD